ncbi:hypothetical protein EC988_000138 [Linderina pennispora]|nr:hypothetical protein EC988_000138 [Linderina pennispora]
MFRLFPRLAARPAAALRQSAQHHRAHPIRHLTTKKTIELVHQRQQAQDDTHTELLDEGDRTGSVASEIERLDPRSIPGLYPDLADDSPADDSWYVDPAYSAPLWQKRMQKRDPAEFANGTLFELCKGVLQQDAEVSEIDVAGRCDWTGRFLVAEAKGTRHMHAMVEELVTAIKQRNRSKGVDAVINVDGRESDDWVVVDLGNFVVHVMTPEARKLYDLEGLWTAEPAQDEDVPEK